MSFSHGHWKCDSCGYSDGNGYPCSCVGCGRENLTLPK